MTMRRFTHWVVLALIGTVAACTSGDEGTTGNTQLNVMVPSDPAGTGTPGPVDIRVVQYTLRCLGNLADPDPPTFLDNDAIFANTVTLNGNLEVVDGRTSDLGAGDVPTEIWQRWMDLPPGDCNLQLRGLDNQGEVICTANEPFVVDGDNSITKVYVVLSCDISFQAPVGQLDADGTFSFNVGNFCPDLFILNAADSTPEPREVAPGIFFTATAVETRGRDGDKTCGQNCDPQDCTPTPIGLSCKPGPDPGFSITIAIDGVCGATSINAGDQCFGDSDCNGAGATCISNGLLDCDGNPANGFDDECVLVGDQLGQLGAPPLPGFISGGAFIACNAPGAVITARSHSTDGDVDCDKEKTIEITCPGLSPCGQYATDGWVCDDGTACTVDACDDTLAVGGSCGGADNGVCCTTTNEPDGTDCSAELPPLASCTGGVCGSNSCTADAQCAASTPVCFVPQTCDQGSGLCIPATPVAGPTGTCSITTTDVCAQDGDCQAGETCNNNTCDAGLGADSGNCDGAGVCEDICAFNPACPPPTGGTFPDNSACNAASCDPVDGTCGFVGANDGTTCDFTSSGSGDGTCGSGTCQFTPDPCGLQAAAIGLGCTNSLTRGQSPFGFLLQVDAPVILANASFTATFDGVAFFPVFFLDAAQGLGIPGGVSEAQLVAAQSNVQVRSGATGPDVPLFVDTDTLVPGATRFCTVPTDRICTQDADCDFGSPCLDPIFLSTIPSSTLCGAGELCEQIGKGVQCAANGFCVTGGLQIDLTTETGTFMADNTPGGEVLFGWAEQGVPDTFICPGTNGEDYNGGASPEGPRCFSNGSSEPAAPDGSVAIPFAAGNFDNPAGPIGLRVQVSILKIPIQCAMGADAGRCAPAGSDPASYPTDTAACLTDVDCTDATNDTCIGAGGACNGGSNDGLPCVGASDCPGATNDPGTCQGGSNGGNPCVFPNDCPNGSCQGTTLMCDLSVSADNDAILPIPDSALISCDIN